MLDQHEQALKNMAECPLNPSVRHAVATVDILYLSF